MNNTTMKSIQSKARIVGILFIIGTAAGILSGVVTMPVLGASHDLVLIAANENKVILGAILVLVMGFPLAMIPVVLYPIFKKENEVLAIGAILFRGALEAVTYMVLVLCSLSLLSLSQELLNAAPAEAASLEALGRLISKTSYWTEHLLALVFTIGALMLYWLFFKTKLVPNWLSLWGFIGAMLYFAAAIFNLLDPQHPALSLGVKWGYLMIPLAIQEMVFAIWMIVKGFKTDALTLESVN